jgi:hypothetical protein
VSVGWFQVAAAGLAQLVHNPLAQPVLRAVLPRLKGLLFDRARSVRLHAADLLLQVIITKIVIDASAYFLSRVWLRNRGQIHSASYDLARNRSPRSHFM